MNLHRPFIVCLRLAAIAICCSLQPSAADNTLPQDSNFDLEGTISKQSAGKLTVDQGRGIIFHVAYDDQTAITKDDGGAGAEKDLKVGLKIRVVGELQTSGEIKAQRIEIQAKQSAPKSESSDMQPWDACLRPLPHRKA